MAVTVQAAPSQPALPDGSQYGSQKLSRGALYLILQNRIYLGETTHKGNSYPGEHAAIVDKPLWDEVQALLAANRVERATGARTKHPSLLTGLLFDEAGERLTPTYAIKKGTRYRYYVSTSLLTGPGKSHAYGRRIPAGNLEGLVTEKVRSFLADPAAILDAVDTGSDGKHFEQGRLLERGRQLAQELDSQAPDQIKTLLTDLLCRIEIRPDRIDIMVLRDRLMQLLATSTDVPVQHHLPAEIAGDVDTLTIQRVGREMRILVESSDDQTPADPALLRIIARSHDINALATEGPDLLNLRAKFELRHRIAGLYRISSQ